MPDAIDLAKERLRSFIERIERIDEEAKTLSDDRAEAFKEAKGIGFDTKIMKTIIKKRKLDADDLEEQEVMEDSYRTAIGMRGLLHIIEEEEAAEAVAPDAAPEPLEAAAE